MQDINKNKNETNNVIEQNFKKDLQQLETKKEKGNLDTVADGD